MLFTPEPKTKREDFFDRAEEIGKLESLPVPVTLVLGLRRTGKSSLIRIALNELGLPYIYLDMREFESSSYIRYKDFLSKFEVEVGRLTKKFPGLREALKRVRGIKIMGNEITFNWGGDDRLNFAFLLEALDDWAENKVVLVLDEAQELVKLRGADLLGPLAYSYDNLGRLKVILSGSEMGLLYRFLRIEDPDSPLFGRFISRIELSPFNREKAVEFLSTGFKELRLSEIDYDKVYEELGGIPGWLTYFGYTYYETKDLRSSLENTLEHARSLIAKEFSNFLRGRDAAKQRYYTIMKQIARNGCSRWSWIKTALEAQAGTTVSDSVIHNYLKALVETSWLTKDEEGYCTPEPLIRRTFSGR